MEEALFCLPCIPCQEIHSHAPKPFDPFIHHGLNRQDSVLRSKYLENQWSLEHKLVLKGARDKAEIERTEIRQILRIKDY